MKTYKPQMIVATMVMLAGGLAAAPTPASATQDFKAITAMVCQPYGPNTTASELQYNQLGVTNPGATNESVFCTIPVDGETPWSSTAGTSANLYPFYHTGGVAGKMACTAFVSNAYMVSGSTYTVTDNPSSNLAANSRSFLSLALADISTGWSIGAPTIVLCTLTPKVTLAGFTFNEVVATNIP